MKSKKGRKLDASIPLAAGSTYLGQREPSKVEKKGYRFSLRWKFFLYIGLIITPVMGIIFVWIGLQEEKRAMDQIINQARILAKQMVITRQWVSDCGGVMVDMESKGAKDTPYFFDDKVKIGDKYYHRFCPAMVTKKLSQYASQQELYRLHLTSLDLLNPENRPDPFEEESLKRFWEGGLNEIFKIEANEKGKFFQYMIPLFLEKTCVKCHQNPNYTVGMVRGGLSIFFPTNNLESFLKKHYLQLGVAGSGLISLTIFILFVLLNKLVIKPVRELEVMAAEIGKGKLEARANITTGDELETLGQAFNSMAENLSHGRDRLQEKINQATRELLQANKELQTLDKLKSDFLSNMSHDLRTPLTVIQGGVDYLKRTTREKDKQNYLEIIDKNLTHLTYLVTNLFDFSKIEAGKVDWHFSRENISGLLQDIIDMTQPLANEKKISVLYEYPGEIYIKMDLERIEQVLVNLIDNAVKFSNPGTEICLKVEETRDSVVVSVQDQGIGIPSDRHEDIFRKFYTLLGGDKGKKGSTGLGLAICKGIIEGHGGRIWVESDVGKGSTFYFSLPRGDRQTFDG